MQHLECQASLQHLQGNSEYPLVGIYNLQLRMGRLVRHELGTRANGLQTNELPAPGVFGFTGHCSSAGNSGSRPGLDAGLNAMQLL